MANVSEQDHELLSAYVDGMLDEQERLALEARLHSEPDLLRALTALYLTLAMVKQLPTLTAPRNFTLKDTPARWLVFPTTPVFSALSAAAATFLVVVGFMLLTTTMNTGTAMPPPAAGESNEVALMSNQTTQSQSPVPTIDSTQTMRDMQATPQETATVMTMMFAATQSANVPPSGGVGGGITTETSIDTFAAPQTPTFIEPVQPEADFDDGTDGESAADPAMMQPQPLSTGTPLPTMSIADAAPAQISADEEASDTSEARFFTPEDEQQAENAVEDTMIAQEPTAEPTQMARSSATPVPTSAPTLEEAPLTAAATVVPAQAPSPRAMTPLLGIALVVGGALLFGIAFMTAVTRRGDRRSRKEE